MHWSLIFRFCRMPFRRCYIIFSSFFNCVWTELCRSPAVSIKIRCCQRVEQTHQQALDVYFRALSGFVRVKYSLLTYWRIYVHFNGAGDSDIVCPSGLGSYSDSVLWSDGHLSLSNRSCLYVWCILFATLPELLSNDRCWVFCSNS